MAFCTTCGAALPADAAFCPNCGRQVAAYGTPAGEPAHGEPPYGRPPPPPTAPPPAGEPYPARLQIDYPDRNLDRLSSALRIFWAIPIVVLLESFNPSQWIYQSGAHGATAGGAGVAIVALPVVLMLLCRRKYPWWWLDWNLELTRFTTRVAVYICLLDDRYPSTDDEQSLHLDLDRPVDAELSRWLPLIKWLLAIPHYIVLAALYLGAFFVLMIVWFAILFTGRYPRWAYDYMVGVFRWSLRVQAYMFLLITDRYPPFSMS